MGQPLDKLALNNTSFILVFEVLLGNLKPIMNNRQNAIANIFILKLGYNLL